MLNSVIRFFCYSAVITAAWILPAAAQPVGEVVNVSEGASFLRGGARIAVEARASVDRGDTIVTNRSGQVEIVFNDDTKLAIGPGSKLVVSRFQQPRCDQKPESYCDIVDIRTPTAWISTSFFFTNILHNA